MFSSEWLREVKRKTGKNNIKKRYSFTKKVLKNREIKKYVKKPYIKFTKIEE